WLSGAATQFKSRERYWSSASAPGREALVRTHFTGGVSDEALVAVGGAELAMDPLSEPVKGVMPPRVEAGVPPPRIDEREEVVALPAVAALTKDLSTGLTREEA
ncbi:MAG: hypothetical protein ACXVYB_05005, partial [Arthrobacter sp.]